MDNDTQALHHQQELEHQEWLNDEQAQKEYQDYLESLEEDAA